MSPIHTIDVSHPPRHPDVVEQELVSAWSTVRNSATLRIIKIVHGHGSTGKGSSTKELVRNWLFRSRTKFRAVIDGEQYEMFNAVVQEMRSEVGQFNDRDLNAANPGITIVWVK